jgi:spermidine/putrescine transport system substrate-binding protein
LLVVSNLVSDKNRDKMSKKAKKITKIVVSSVFGAIALITLIVFISTAGTKTVQLNVYNWGEYISDGSEDSYDSNAEFEKYYERLHYEKYGEKIKVQVNYTTFASNEDLYAKLKSGASGYDVIVPSDYMIERLKADGLLLPLNLDNIPNYENLADQFKNPFYDNDPNEKYSVMYTYGIIGIIYNKDKMDPADLEKIENGEAGWELLWDEKYAGQILQFNNARDAFGTAMYALGIDVNNATPEEWKMAFEKLKAQKPLVQSYVMDEIYNKMEGGEATLAAYYAGDCLSMIANNESLGFFYPKNENGEYVTNIYADAMCIPVGAENKELAEIYIDFMLSEEHEAARANAEFIYYASPNMTVVSNPDYIDYLGEDYELIYDPNFDSPYGDGSQTYLEYMFNTYAYRDMNDENRATLNRLWEELKVDSTSFNGGIYIICIVIALLIVAFGVYKYIQKRQRRRLYWNNPIVKKQSFEFTSTMSKISIPSELREKNDEQK